MVALVLFLAVPILLGVIAMLLAMYHRGNRHQQNVMAYQRRRLVQLQQQRMTLFVQPADPAATVARLNQLLMMQQQALPQLPPQHSSVTPASVVANLPKFAYGVINASASSKVYGSGGRNGSNGTGSSGPGNTAAAEDPQDICCICFSEFQPKDQCTMLPCCHHYHSECITTWLARSKHCPLCNSDVVAAAQFLPGGLIAAEPGLLSQPPRAAVYQDGQQWAEQQWQQQRQEQQQEQPVHLPEPPQMAVYQDGQQWGEQQQQQQQHVQEQQGQQHQQHQQTQRIESSAAVVGSSHAPRHVIVTVN